MSLKPFDDKELNIKMKELDCSNVEEKSAFPEQSFILTCLKIGLNISDLKYLTYVDVMKMFYNIITSNEKNNNNERNATQEDIERFFGS